MSNILFDIPNPPSNTIILDPTRKGLAQFTVNNISGRPLRRVAGRLTPIPDAAAAYGKWLSLTPSDFSEYGIAGSQQYTVQITAPADAAAGSYSFRLDVWEDANPDDTLMSSPSISFTVPAPEVKPKTTIPWWIPVIAAAVVILIVGIIIINPFAPSPPPITPTVTTPPPVVGNFNGHWNLAGTGQTAGARADIVQSGSTVHGAFFNGTSNGTLIGIISGLSMSGQWQAGGSAGTFTWILVNQQSRQFQGVWSSTNAWCGFRDGSVQPNPCKPNIVIKIPPDIEKRLPDLKLTLVAP
ncbi:MAG: hypothetical protein M1434_01955 [Chloroflexi bacterium]|nr:hypothetical protein [Chloroflexota bacterium]MCL5273493.1 hypothetical protein [Chloroflexota bacterium]